MFPKPYPWQFQQWEHLLARHANDTLPHALLLGGPQGLGKLDFAKAMAAYLLCEENHKQYACGQCRTCLLLAAGSHPDYQILQLEEEGKAIKIEQVRELILSLSQTAQNSKKVVVLSPAEAMNKASANALLKVLEEPSGEVVFLLVSHQPGNLFPTIRSRCQLVSFAVPPVEVSLPWLHTQLTSELSAELLLTLAEKLPLRALVLSEEKQWNAYQNWISSFIQFAQGRIDLIQMATVCVNLEQDQLIFRALYLLIKDVLWLQYTQNKPEQRVEFLVHLNHLENLMLLSQTIQSTKLFLFLDKLIHFQKQLQLKISLNKNLLWESVFIEWLLVIK